MVRLVERIPATGRDDVGLDDCVMMFYLGLVAFDHVRHRVWIIRNVFTRARAACARNTTRRCAKFERTRRMLDAAIARRAARARAAKPLHVDSNMTKPQFVAAVRKAKKYIRAGDVFQMVVSQRFSAKTKADPFEIYRALRVVNPSPYLYFLQARRRFGGRQLARNAGEGSGARRVLQAAGRNASARPRRRKKTASSKPSCSPIRRSAPST